MQASPGCVPSTEDPHRDISMPLKQSKYTTLPYLDAIHQLQTQLGPISALKQPLRQAVNYCRTNEANMKELLNLLEDTLKHIHSVDKPKVKRTPKKKVEDYTLPS